MRSPDICTKHRNRDNEQIINPGARVSFSRKPGWGWKWQRALYMKNNTWIVSGRTWAARTDSRTQLQWLLAAVNLTELTSEGTPWKQREMILLLSPDASLFPSSPGLGYIWAHFHPCWELITENPEMWEWTGNTVGCFNKPHHHLLKY